ncbi:MBOAT family O-acyltransferase [Clostridium aminobutyricum]|uniref:MBOAT family protein n=1 Tax=Clostridium aminobutyricum TaxID=33953 RepID=A0A939D797_CLOAM|nr:MBOAT family protein [Clostridium aminobutyricum]MBN7772386.1 MBOAT family protein [Clostridium aminobutyricum]
MLFSSLVFMTCFLPAVLFLYYTVFRFNRIVQNVFLLIVSLGFYAWGEPKFVFVLIGSFLMNWGFGLLVAKYKTEPLRAKITIAIMLIFNISIIFVFKYLMFTMKNIKQLFDVNLDIPTILLPIGISFFTFQAISYVIDIYRGHGEVQRNPLNVGLYIAFFPQLVAGPIVRYETIADQIMDRKESFEDVSQGVCRFLVGLAKKVLLANNFALVADKAFNMGSDELSMGMAWLGAICYTLQIYYDFSGYSDMAIGLGRMFGFKFPENFNYPYISKSTTEFWRRWHISLGSWFRDYVYIPMGGSRVKSTGRIYFNLFVVWSLTGLWHGANWTFICWGLLYFVSLSIEKTFGIDKIQHHRVFLHLYTMLLVILGWVLFRSENITDAFIYMKTMFIPGTGGIIDPNAIVCTSEYLVFLIFGIIFSTPIAKEIKRRRIAKTKLSKALYVIVMIGLFLACISYLVKGAYNPFIYFNF